MAHPVIEPLVTVEQLASMPDDGNRYEVIEGEIFVSSAPGLPHQSIVGALSQVFRNHLDAHPVGAAFPGPGVILSPYNGVIPDFVYISNERLQTLERSGRIMGAPELAVEILSPGKENEERDRIAKLQLYSRYGVSEYWIVDPSRRTVEVYRRTDLRLPLIATLLENDALTTPLLPGFECPLSKIFAR